MTKPLEKIISVAILSEASGGLLALPTGFRHSDVMLAMQTLKLSPGKQGFLTDRYRFVNRTEAMKVAKAAGQFIERDEDDPQFNSTNELYSEDLW